MKAKKKFWLFGEITEFAKLARISAKNLSDILARRRGVSYQRALKLELVSLYALAPSRRIYRDDWMQSATTKHPAFKPLKRRGKK